MNGIDEQTVDPAEALAALAHAADLLGRADLGTLGDRSLLEHAQRVDRQVTRAQAQVGRVLRDINARKAYREQGFVTTASWWRAQTRRDHHAAVRQVRTACRLRRFDVLRDAVESGEVGWAHAVSVADAAIARRREAIAEHEDTLVELARRGTPRDVARACDRIADLVDPDGTNTSGGDQSGPDERRSLYHHRTINGLGDIRATLDPVTSHRFAALLDAYDQPDPPGTGALRRRSHAQRRHDAFDRILRAAEEHPDASTVHGSPPRALLFIDLMTLLGRHDLASRRTMLGSGTEIGVDRAVQMLEQSSLTPVLMLGPYRPVGVGRTSRTLPAWLRPLLAMIHGHCRGPGCDRPMAWTQAMHMDAWHAGGDTDLLRTVPGCQAHHKLFDIVGWKLEYDPDTAVCTWTSPDGEVTVHTHPPDP